MRCKTSHWYVLLAVSSHGDLEMYFGWTGAAEVEHSRPLRKAARPGEGSWGWSQLLILACVFCGIKVKWGLTSDKFVVIVEVVQYCQPASLDIEPDLYPESLYKKWVSICDSGWGKRRFIPHIHINFPFVIDDLLEHDRDMRAVLEDKRFLSPVICRICSKRARWVDQNS